MVAAIHLESGERTASSHLPSEGAVRYRQHPMVGGRFLPHLEAMDWIKLQIAAAAAFTLLAATGAVAQAPPAGYSLVPASEVPHYARTYAGISYGWADPTGDFRNTISNDSWINFTLEGHQLVHHNFSVGLILGWNSLYQNDINDKRFNLFPALLDFRVLLHKPGSKAPIPYIGGGIGTTYGIQYVTTAALQASASTFAFTLAPEVGIIFPTPNSGVALGARWYYNASSTYLSSTSYSPQYFLISIALLYAR
jgi:hypothetical protein